MKLSSLLCRRAPALLLTFGLAASSSLLHASKGSDDSSSNSGSNSGSGSGSGSSSGKGSSGSGNSGNSGSSSSNGGNNSGQDTDNSGDDRGGSNTSSNTSPNTATPSSRSAIQGKSEAMVEGFQAEFNVRLEHRADRTTFRAETENLNLPVGTVLTVCQGSTALGSFTLGTLKFGELELDSRNGQSIPELKGGDVLTLNRGGCGGAKLLSATLGAPSASSSSTPTPATQSDTLTEARSRRLIQGFEAELHVRLEHRADRDKLSVEAENLNLGAGTRLDVCLNDARIGDLFLNALNAGELELDSRNGATVPALQPADKIELRRGGCADELILSATIGAAAPAQQEVLRTQLEGETKRVIDAFEAEFKSRFEQTPDRTKLTAEVTNLNVPASTRLTVCFAGKSLGDIVVNAIHFGEVELDSRNGATVPGIKPGDIVELHRSGCAAADLLMSVALAPVL